MDISKEDMNWAAGEGIISPEQATELWAALEKRSAGRPMPAPAPPSAVPAPPPKKSAFAPSPQSAPRAGAAPAPGAPPGKDYFAPETAAGEGGGLIRGAYYAGGFLVFIAMTLFANIVWAGIGGKGLFLVTAIYGIGFAMAGKTLWYEQNMKEAGGVLYLLAVLMVPIAVYGVELWFDTWPSYNYHGSPLVHGAFNYHGNFLFMELATIIASFAAFYRIRYPLLMIPAAVCLWLASLDCAALMGHGPLDFEASMGVTLVFGIAVVAVSYYIDRRFGEEFATYLYAAGLLSFLAGLTLLLRHYDPLLMFVYFIICSLGITFAGIYLRRPIFYAFAIGGTLIYCFAATFNTPHQMHGSEPIYILFNGAAVCLAAYLFDRRLSYDLAGWFYLFGAFGAWAGLIAAGSGSEAGKLLFLFYNILYIFIAVLLERRVFAILGGVGAIALTGNFAYVVFRDSIAFPFVMVLFGIFIIYVGVRAQQNIGRLNAFAESLPSGIRAMVPSSRTELWDR